MMCFVMIIKHIFADAVLRRVTKEEKEDRVLDRRRETEREGERSREVGVDRGGTTLLLASCACTA